MPGHPGAPHPPAGCPPRAPEVKAAGAEHRAPRSLDQDAGEVNEHVWHDSAEGLLKGLDPVHVLTEPRGELGRQVVSRSLSIRRSGSFSPMISSSP